MAYVKIKQVKVSLDKALAYIMNDVKTEQGELCSTNMGVMKSAQDLADRMLKEQEYWSKEKRGAQGTVLAHHIIQSFSPEDDITPQQAHEIGERFIEEFSNGEYHYVIATHIDKGHIHNHIMLSPTNYVTGKRLVIQKNTLKKLRDLSDVYCKEHGLHVTRQKVTKRYGKARNDLYAQLKGISLKELIRSSIDRAAGMSGSWNEFVNTLATLDIVVKVRGDTLTFTHLVTGKQFRDVRLGGAYDEQNIMAKIGCKNLNEISFNKALIKQENARTVTVWLPGTRRTKTLTIGKEFLVRDGSSVRAYLPKDSEQIVAYKNGQFAQRITSEALYEFFAPPELNMNKLIKYGFDDLDARNPAMRKRLIAQAYKLEEIRKTSAAISVISDYMLDNSMSISQAKSALAAAIRDKKEQLQSLVVVGLEDEGLSKSIQEQLSVLEQDISNLARQTQALQDTEARISGKSEQQDAMLRTRRSGR